MPAPGPGIAIDLLTTGDFMRVSSRRRQASTRRLEPAAAGLRRIRVARAGAETRRTNQFGIKIATPATILLFNTEHLAAIFCSSGQRRPVNLCQLIIKLRLIMQQDAHQ
jgi:hypothetical protein